MEVGLRLSGGGGARIKYVGRRTRGIYEDARGGGSIGITDGRGGAAFSDTGVSGFLPGQYSNRRADIHEKAKT